MAETYEDFLACELIDRNADLRSERATWETVWQSCANYVIPRKSQITETKTPDIEGFTQDLYNHTAIRSNYTLAAGQINYITPANEMWGAFEAPAGLKESEEAKSWFAKCSEIALKEIRTSNFYLEIHESHLNRGALGTASLLCEEGTFAKPLNFKAHDTGTYSIEENAEGIVDVWFHEFKLSARNIVDRYGIENVGKTIKEAYEQNGGKGRSKKFPLLYCIFPRKDSDRLMNRMDGPNMPYAAVTVDVENKKLVKNSGFLEFPGGVTRYLKWGDAPYGYCPTIEALPLMRQVNFIEQQLDALAELAAFPRILIPDTLEGEVDLRAGGGTIVRSMDMARGEMPREWATQGRYDYGIDRVERKIKEIQDAYHVDLFNALAVREKTMTATEVLEIVAEKLILFSPTFARLVTELLNPIMRRVFSILLRKGKFPPVPMSVLVSGEDGNPAVADPEIVYVSKIALATKAIENRSWNQFWMILVQILEVDQSALDWVNMDKVVKGVAENLGIRNDWLNGEEAVAAIREAKAQQQQAAAALQALSEGGKGVAAMSNADPAMMQRLTSQLGN